MRKHQYSQAPHKISADGCFFNEDNESKANHEGEKQVSNYSQGCRNEQRNQFDKER